MAPAATATVRAQHAEVRQKPLLVLDLDGTLVDARREQHGRGSARAGPTRRMKPPDVKSLAGCGHTVRFRPGLAGFLSACATRYDLAVWSAAPHFYVHAIVDAISAHVGWGDVAGQPASFRESVVFVMTGDDTDCEWKGKAIKRKPIKRAAGRGGYSVWRTLIVDDTWTTFAHNKSHALPVPTYKGEPTCDVLVRLSAFLVDGVCTGGTNGVLDVSGWEYAEKGVSPLNPASFQGRALGGGDGGGGRRVASQSATSLSASAASADSDSSSDEDDLL